MIRFRHIWLTFSCILLFFAATAQKPNDNPLEDVTNDVKNNKMTDLAKFFDNTLPITINNNQSVYSRSQAEMVLKDFFDRNEPKDFIVTDNGTPTTGTKFAICTFTASGGRYTMYILMRQKDITTYILQEIKLTKQ